jgi:hypothetical protein
MSSGTGKPTLYERLGGVYSIAAVVDDFIDRVMHNPVLNANAAVDEAHHRVSAAGFKYYVTEMVCWATGGTAEVHRPFHERVLTSTLRSPRVSGPPFAMTSMTRWPNSMCPKRSTRNCLPSWRAPRATLFARHRLCDDCRLPLREMRRRGHAPRAACAAWSAATYISRNSI